jgi:uncharacterized RDD family membrane protein YckC
VTDLREPLPTAEILRTPLIGAALTSRLIAYLIDIVMIALLTGVLFVVIAILGVLTLSLGWALFPLLAGTGLLYSALTIGGRHSATIGMRMMGIRVMTGAGTKPDWLIATVHALLFYVAASTALLLFIDIAIGLLRRDRRVGHDLVTDLVVINTT